MRRGGLIDKQAAPKRRAVRSPVRHSFHDVMPARRVTRVSRIHKNTHRTGWMKTISV